MALIPDFTETINIDGFDLTLVGPETEYQSEPFSYTVRIKNLPEYDEEENLVKPTTITVRCNDIPCDLCRFQDECDNGAHVTETIGSKIENLFPEIFI